MAMAMAIATAMAMEIATAMAMMVNMMSKAAATEMKKMVKRRKR